MTPEHLAALVQWVRNGADLQHVPEGVPFSAEQYATLARWAREQVSVPARLERGLRQAFLDEARQG